MRTTVTNWIVRPRAARPFGAAAVALWLAGCAVAPATSPVPQPGTLANALRRTELRPDSATKRLSRSRFPLYFAVNVPYGNFWSPGRTLILAAYGHGPTAARHRSISLEFLFWDERAFEPDLAIVRRVMTELGLPAGVQDSAEAIIRRRRQTTGNALYGWMNEAREVAGYQVRVESHLTTSFYIVQMTDARVPEARWPSPGDVEALQPFTRRPFFDANMDVPGVIEPEVTRLRCRNAGPDAYLCSYMVVGRGGESPDGPHDRYTDLFRRGMDGKWTIELRSSDQPERKWY